MRRRLIWGFCHITSFQLVCQIVLSENLSIAKVATHNNCCFTDKRIFGAKYLQFPNLPSPSKKLKVFYLSQSQWGIFWNVFPRCKFGYTCKMSNAVDWPAMRWVFSCVTQYQLIILNERTQYQLIISNGRDHSHRIDRSDRFKQDKSRAEKLSIQFWRDKNLRGPKFFKSVWRKIFFDTTCWPHWWSNQGGHDDDF